MKNLFALLLLYAGLLFAGIVVASETGPDLLTPTERAWLAEHPQIVLGIGEEWVPAVVKDANMLGVLPLFQPLDLAEQPPYLESDQKLRG